MHLLQHLLKIKYCKIDKDEDFLKYFKKLTSPLNLRYIFNPSFYCDNDVKIFAFRGVPIVNDWLFSFISVEDKNGHSVKNVSLDLYEELNGIRLIDPKVTKLNEEFYITFNSGWIPQGNDIFIMKVYPTIESPKRLIYKNRQKQERNWAFFSEEGEIYALYWINPLKILKLKHAGPASWEMENYYCEERQNNNLSNDFTIGTQLSKLDDRYYFVAHKKFCFWRKKIYMGRFFVLDFNKKKIGLGKYWLAHSFKSLFGSTVKTNTNLLSCTYFSGIQATSASIKLGYGINDVEYGFSTHKFEDL